MKRAWLAIPAMALCMGFAPIASAQQPGVGDEPFKFDDLFKTAANKDGMVSKESFMKAAGMRYDAMLAKMKKMPADKSKTLMKGDMMTKEGFKMFVDEWKIYSGS